MISKKIAVLGFVAGLAFASTASAQFVGDYDPANWTLDQTPGANGFVQSHTASELILVGSDTGSGNFSYTDLFITVAEDGFISFDWAYDSIDLPGFDSSLYFSSGSGFVLLSATPGESGSILNLPVSAGDLFAFSIETADNEFGPGELTVTNFSFVPTPSTAGLLGLGGLMAARSRR
jgi:hypothetical protein